MNEVIPSFHRQREKQSSSYPTHFGRLAVSAISRIQSCTTPNKTDTLLVRDNVQPKRYLNPYTSYWQVGF